MSEKKEDLRLVKTRRTLLTAMFVLLEKNSFAKITVNDLCAEALVSRSTFYSHFDDKYHLMEACLEVLRERLFVKDDFSNIQQMIRHVLQSVQNHVRVFKNLLMQGPDSEVFEALRLLFHRGFEEMVSQAAFEDRLKTIPLEMLSLYYASGITAVVMLWIAGGMTHSIDEMTSYLSALLNQA